MLYSKLKLTKRYVGDVVVIDAVGKIILGEESHTLRETFRDLAARGNQKILLNLLDVTQLGAGMRELIVCGAVHVNNHGGKLKLICRSERMLLRLGIVGINPDPFIKHFPDVHSGVYDYIQEDNEGQRWKYRTV